MGRPAQHARSAPLLLLLVAACASASSQPAFPSVMDTLRAGLSKAGGPAHVSTAAIQADEYGYDSGYHTEEKELCLLENERTACFDSGDDNRFWSSQLSCCDGHEHYQGSRRDVGSALFTPYNSVGSCDWTILDGDGATADTTGPIVRGGSASAICYFGADSDKCGGPALCDRMVMSLEGSLYFVNKAYSHSGRSNTYAFGGECGYYVDIARRAQRTGNTTRSGAHSKMAKSGTHKPAGAAARPASQFAETQDYGASYHDDNRVVYEGQAVVINGLVTAVSGPRKEKWEDGTFEHTVDFFNQASADGSPILVTGALDPNVPFVQDKTYKFTFYKSGQYYK